ncbi:NAD(P)-binding protein [Fragilariopsis cylindrus CCMP1102]|uniref:NAD(P)-binding protein n=1 Tax=Fragilariopsis cylindrus CCMP1102 TaxID=635003 RepID=A0A1E7FJX5_9STRA|nr:NAD(P)-binding protein [Fragilariopsis cylindrus CCMP1102]|eukprot:OEU18481.1 NAD(P)-binding protein [Fragilariopsis cylindrus CCMP1102]
MRLLQVLWPTTIGVYFLLLAITISTTDGLNIAITGSSQGIGLEAATRLIAEGHTVYHACRNQERANVAQQESGGGIPMICDLNDFTSIRHFAEQLIKKSTPENGGLDVLCLNAGIAPSTKSIVPKLTKDGYEECIGVNHLGHFLLANLLKDHLLQESSSNSGRIVITASSVHDPEGPGGAVGGKGGATLVIYQVLVLILLLIRIIIQRNYQQCRDGSITYDGGKIYKDSKLCNLLFMREAVKRWGGKNGNDNDKDDGLQILSFNPGFIPSSGLFRAPRADNWLGATAFTIIAGVVGFAVPIEIGGGRLAYMATVNTSKSTSSTDGIIKNGSYFSADVKSKGTTIEDGFDDQTTISMEASNDDIASQLWDISAKIVGV